jgi:hypothetical protein
MGPPLRRRLNSEVQQTSRRMDHSPARNEFRAFGLPAGQPSLGLIRQPI